MLEKSFTNQSCTRKLKTFKQKNHKIHVKNPYYEIKTYILYMEKMCCVARL